MKLAQNALHQNLSLLEMRLECLYYRNPERRSMLNWEQLYYSKRISGGRIIQNILNISLNSALTLSWQPLGSLQLALTWLKKLEDPKTRYGLFAAYSSYAGYWTSGSWSKNGEVTHKFVKTERITVSPFPMASVFKFSGIPDIDLFAMAEFWSKKCLYNPISPTRKMNFKVLTKTHTQQTPDRSDHRI